MKGTIIALVCFIAVVSSASYSLADVVYNLTRSPDGSPLVLVEDVKVD